MIDQDETTIEQVTKRQLERRLRTVIKLVTAVAKKGAKNIERIHRLRTELRRADVALRLFRDWLPSHRVERIRRRLDKIRRYAGSVRDVDVVLPLIEEPFHPLTEPTVKWLLEQAATVRAQSAHPLRRSCQRLLESGIKSQLHLLTSRIRWRQDALMPGPKEVYCSMIDTLSTKFVAAIDSLKNDVGQLHKVRILGKRLRYTIELLTDAFPETPIEAVGQALAQMQESIGQVNDQKSEIRFLCECVEECDQIPNPVELINTIDSLEQENFERANIAVREVLDKSRQVGDLLEELASKN